MNQLKTISVLLGLATSLVLGANSVAAATTEGTILFDQDPLAIGDVHTPNPATNQPEVITIAETEGKTTGNGLLRLQFVPNFKFGTYQGISAQIAEQPVTLINYEHAGKAQSIAPFVQVGDNRGERGRAGYWRVDVSATPFENFEQTERLNNIEIRLSGRTLTMDYEDSQKAQRLIKGHDQSNSIKTDNKSKTLIMETQENQDTSGYQVSNVFHNNYQKEMEYRDAEGQLMTTTTGVEFYKPRGESPVRGVEYISTLTWTLTSGL